MKKQLYHHTVVIKLKNDTKLHGMVSAGLLFRDVIIFECELVNISGDRLLLYKWIKKELYHHTVLIKEWHKVPWDVLF